MARFGTASAKLQKKKKRNPRQALDYRNTIHTIHAEWLKWSLDKQFFAFTMEQERGCGLTSLSPALYELCGQTHEESTSFYTLLKN